MIGRIRGSVARSSDIPHYRCSFCGKSQEHVSRFIAGPGVYICNECVELCQEIIGEEAIAAVPGGGGVERAELATHDSQVATRKADHIRICLEEDVSGQGITTGFER